jgi:phosphoserine phosphatase RsbU/P
VHDGEAGVLIVDDNQLDRKLLRTYLSKEAYELDFAEDGLQAMTMLARRPLPYDVVLLDRAMPRMSGMEVLAAIKADPRLRMLPVIMQTAAASPAEMQEGLRAGAYYYLTKPYDPETLVAIVGTAARDYTQYKELLQQLRSGMQCLRLLQNAKLLIRTVEEARDAATVFVNACPDPERTVIGLTELLVNAVEHGNLGVTYEEKSRLNSEGTWIAELHRRRELPENRDKRVEFEVERTPAEVRFTIRDEGPGFDWQKYLDVDPKRAFDNHGRGIAIARGMSFDRLEYHGRGNEVVAVVSCGKRAKG